MDRINILLLFDPCVCYTDIRSTLIVSEFNLYLLVEHITSSRMPAAYEAVHKADSHQPQDLPNRARECAIRPLTMQLVN